MKRHGPLCPRRSTTLEASKGVSVDKKESVLVSTSPEVEQRSSSHGSIECHCPSEPEHEATMVAVAEADWDRKFLSHRQTSLLYDSPKEDQGPSLPVVCGHGCRVDPHYAGPHVIAISACGDEQLAWEHPQDGGCLTKVLISFLEKNPEPTIRALMEYTRYMMILHLYPSILFKLIQCFSF
ncbi:hypothetical protein DAEQUDRAFT_277251 [Daedalea quercina L-15889]|uniref:Uncharacterized protein n=1 Tax=Daedalea quercina L-15889 TaxID=1314783 RepID=A0A165Q7S3_9APHY|nr:hypothetical protein DAEQUDRAFT_277251 [Daedalea quercina L-15889]